MNKKDWLRWHKLSAIVCDEILTSRIASLCLKDCKDFTRHSVKCSVFDPELIESVTIYTIEEDAAETHKEVYCSENSAHVQSFSTIQ